MKNKDEIRNHIIQSGIRNLNEFGYPDVNSENILTDEIYSQFFKSMLEDNKGYHSSTDIVIDELLNIIADNETK